jgi:hypothetical protein
MLAPLASRLHPLAAWTAKRQSAWLSQVKDAVGTADGIKQAHPHVLPARTVRNTVK